MCILNIHPRNLCNVNIINLSHDKHPLIRSHYFKNVGNSVQLPPALYDKHKVATINGSALLHISQQRERELEVGVLQIIIAALTKQSSNDLFIIITSQHWSLPTHELKVRAISSTEPV